MSGNASKHNILDRIIDSTENHSRVDDILNPQIREVEVDITYADGSHETLTSNIDLPERASFIEVDLSTNCISKWIRGNRNPDKGNVIETDTVRIINLAHVRSYCYKVIRESEPVIHRICYAQRKEPDGAYKREDVTGKFDFKFDDNGELVTLRKGILEVTAKSTAEAIKKTAIELTHIYPDIYDCDCGEDRCRAHAGYRYFHIEPELKGECHV